MLESSTTATEKVTWKKKKKRIEYNQSATSNEQELKTEHDISIIWTWNIWVPVENLLTLGNVMVKQVKWLKLIHSLSRRPLLTRMISKDSKHRAPSWWSTPAKLIKAHKSQSPALNRYVFTYWCTCTTSQSLAVCRGLVSWSSVPGHISISRHSNDQPTCSRITPSHTSAGAQTTVTSHNTKEM